MPGLERDRDVADAFIVTALRSYCFHREDARSRADTPWEDVLDRAAWHGVAPLLYFAFKNSPHFNAPDWVLERLQASFLNSFMRQALYEDELEGLLTYLRGEGAEVIVMKGFVLSRLIYPDPALRTFVDIDVLFKEKDWHTIRKFLLKAGYIPLRDHETLPLKIIKGEVFEHVLTFYNEAGLKLELKLDPFDLGIGSRMIGQVWERSVVHDFGTLTCRALAPEYQLLHLLFHLNQHGFKKMRWAVDIGLILTSEQPLDWELMIHAAKRDEILAPVYFSLLYVCGLFGIEPDEELLDRLRPGYIKRMVWRSVWPEEDIARFNGVEYGALLFPKRIRSKWLIPNMLLTGKKAAKTGYFLRRVFPSSDFLERKYSNGVKRSYAYYMVRRYAGLLKHSGRAESERTARG